MYDYLDDDCEADTTGASSGKQPWTRADVGRKRKATSSIAEIAGPKAKTEKKVAKEKKQEQKQKQEKTHVKAKRVKGKKNFRKSKSTFEDSRASVEKLRARLTANCHLKETTFGVANKGLYNVGSDFSGLGTDCLAFQRAGIAVRHCWASEKHGPTRKLLRSIVGKRVPVSKDITQRDHSKLEAVDIYTAGPACPPWSTQGWGLHTKCR